MLLRCGDDDGHHSHHFAAAENTQGETVAAMRSGDVLSFEGDMRQSGGKAGSVFG